MKVFWSTCGKEPGGMKPVNENCYKMLYLKTSRVAAFVTLSPPSESVTKPHGFLMFSGGRERVHWERMG